DQDGLSDGVEVYIYGTSPFTSDTDGDKYDDFLEILMGRDPLIKNHDRQLLFGLYLLPVYIVVVSVPPVTILIIKKRRKKK
ncbi:MAG: hypothetical protein HGN29_16755, partial [Asgard group archaeon]|nr:hypothetical protein [Asgard group archaeon]